MARRQSHRWKPPVANQRSASTSGPRRPSSRLRRPRSRNSKCPAGLARQSPPARARRGMARWTANAILGKASDRFVLAHPALQLAESALRLEATVTEQRKQSGAVSKCSPKKYNCEFSVFEGGSSISHCIKRQSIVGSYLESTRYVSASLGRFELLGLSGCHGLSVQKL